jgi:hypothetical protein
MALRWGRRDAGGLPRLVGVAWSNQSGSNGVACALIASAAVATVKALDAVNACGDADERPRMSPIALHVALCTSTVYTAYLQSAASSQQVRVTALKRSC